MKLKQREYCHNCNQYVEFEFEDVTSRQVIHCPSCGHEHYREIDSGTLTNIQVNNAQVGREIRVAEIPRFSCITNESDMSKCSSSMIKTARITGVSKDGRAIVEKNTNFEGEDTTSITQRRWGRDSRQRG